VSEILTVFTAELVRKLRSRVFLFATGAGVFAITLLVSVPGFLSQALRTSNDVIVLAGPQPVRSQAAALLGKRDFKIVASVESLPHPVTLPYLNKHSKAAAAVAVSVRAGRLHLDVYPRDMAAFDEIQFRDLIPLNIALATGRSAASVESATRVDRTLHPLDDKFADARSATFARGIAFALVFILYFAIIVASQSVMSAVAEEKTSRIAEILIATISPVNLLTGKTLAAAALAILQIGVWVAAAAFLFPHSILADRSNELSRGGAAPGPADAAAAVGPGLIDPGVIVAFAVFFILGYLQYTTIYAAAASLISRTEDLGLVTTPVILPVVGAFFVAQYALVQPDAPFVVAFSFIPFFSPFVIFTRIATSSVPGWQIGLAVAINALTVAVCFYAAGKIYRVGMLLYGKLPSPRQVWNALRA
jgi:ABC-type Na+ efflux pump permease subunit